ncbi:MAG TPA: hypothetical protein VML94_01235 [Thermoplasmata archaeon]|nr:hypothetical protein [Thermoplasmata archaeon]
MRPALRPGPGVAGTSITALATAVAVAALLLGFALAALADLRRREVSDRLWQAMGAVGLVTGAVLVSPGGWVPIVLWLLVAGLTLEHLAGWDLWFGARWEARADLVELAAYVGVIAVVAIAAARTGIGASGVPWIVVAVLATIVLARGLFEFKVLYGAADAKALMIAALLVPVFPVPWLYAPSTAAATLAYVPFAISLLTNAALFSIVVPIALAVRNARRGEFSVPEGFMGYWLAVRELPRRFVWVKDPAVPATGEEDADTTEEDDRRRAELARSLRARGIDRVWVTPQVPLVAVMAVGALAALLAGNLLLDLMLRV